MLGISSFCVNDSEFEFGGSLKFHHLRFYLDVNLDGSTFDSEQSGLGTGAFCCSLRVFGFFP